MTGLFRLFAGQYGRQKETEEALKAQAEAKERKGGGKQKGNFISGGRNMSPTGPKPKPRRDSWRDEL
eukprot:2834219-Pyramimonas_sp.AAC.2